MAQTSMNFQGRYESKQMKYVGGFKDNTFHGLGVETGENYKYEGKYINGLKNEGKMTWKDKNGNYEYLGTFNQNNKFHGKGKT